MKSALVLIDIQNDFLPGGTIPVPEGDQIIARVNSLMECPFDLVIASKDWHSPDHCSFAASHPGKDVGARIEVEGQEQILWPVHCVQNSHGAAFAPELKTEKIQAVFCKGIDPQIDSYSAFFDNGRRKATGMGDFLKQNQVQFLFFAGLATEYCVKYSVLDALRLGFKVAVIEDSCKGIDFDDAVAAIQEMRLAGVLTTSTRVLCGNGGFRCFMRGAA